MIEEHIRYIRGCYYCKTGTEFDVIQRFNNTFPDGQAIVPTRTKIRRTRFTALEEQVPLLPGYVFIQITVKEADTPDIIDEYHVELLKISKMDSVLKLLRYSDGGWILHGSDDLFAEMLFKTGGNIGLSQAYFDKGDRIRILDGFLKDYEGNITSVNRKNKTVEVIVIIQEKKVIMRLGYELVEPVTKSTENKAKAKK